MQLALIARRRSRTEPFWHVQLALVLAIALQLVLSNKLVVAPKDAIAGLEAGLLIIVSLPLLGREIKRVFALGLMTLITLANLSSLILVIHQLLTHYDISGSQLLVSGVAIYLTNIIVFGLLYWELDATVPDEPDFLFPQFSDSKYGDWKPTFFDYLYISITNASAFSPTDTLPLTHRAKLLMTVQSITSLITVALVAARAVNILQ